MTVSAIGVALMMAVCIVLFGVGVYHALRRQDLVPALEGVALIVLALSAVSHSQGWGWPR